MRISVVGPVLSRLGPAPIGCLPSLARLWCAGLCKALLLASALALIACASGPKTAFHAFSFDGFSDKWDATIELLEYSYGDQYHMVRRKAEPPSAKLPSGTGVAGTMPVGDFLYVRWAIKATGELREDRVDLRPLLPASMEDFSLTFVIDGRQLYVYLVTPKSKHEDDPPLLKTYLSRYNVTYEIYPLNTFIQP